VPSIISVRNLGKTYASGFQALKHIDLEIQRGEIFALLGPNGAGKTTLINIICGIVTASEGQVLAEAAGIDLALLARAIRASDQRIGGAATLMFRPTVAPLRPDVPTDAGLIEPMAAAARLAHKDLRAARELADALGVAVPVARLTDAYCDAIFGVGRTPSTSTAGVGQTPSGASPGSPS